ncbi:MAG: hypothetical protein PHO65_01090 [Sulfurovum sp.]|nr:hypothetical protein [Sulfurovum sp.]
MNISYISKKARIDDSISYEHPIRIYGNAVVKAKSSIGSFTFINTGTTLFRGTKVGRYCSIGKSCELGAFDHPIDWLSSSPFQYNMKMHFPDFAENFSQINFNRPRETIIGNDVWIGSLSIIKRGVTIGDGAIIAGGQLSSMMYLPMLL